MKKRKMLALGASTVVLVAAGYSFSGRALAATKMADMQTVITGKGQFSARQHRFRHLNGKSVRGTITAVHDNAFDIQSKNGGSKSIQISSVTKIHTTGGVGMVADLQPGQSVLVLTEAKAGQLVAREIWVGKVPKLGS